MDKKTINRREFIQKYLNFFKSKNHKIIPSASLIPENDPTVLFTTAGMQPLVPYFLGQKHPLGKKIANVQRCIRTTDINEVGDETHHTFFEMLGNWSLGDYWKKEAIEMSFEFLTKIIGIPVEKLAVSVFEGESSLSIPPDNESAKIWKSLGIKKERIIFLSKKENWWGPAGETGPCGPDTEIFYWSHSEKKEYAQKKFNPNDKRWIEIWNNVFIEYNKINKKNYVKLSKKNVDTGMGVERTVAILNGLRDNYLTDSFLLIIKKIEEISGKKYKSDLKSTKAMRIIADHLKASVFIIADGIIPSNVERGYVLRRLIRRSIRYGKYLGIKNFTSKTAEPVFEIYKDYTELKNNKKKILETLNNEEDKFNKTLQKGLNIFHKIIRDKKDISGKDAFLLYQSYGFPIEITEELAKEKEIKINLKEFKNELKKHQRLSQTISSGIFKSGLTDHSEKTTRMHTATHLLNEALKQILGSEIKQKGSNITPERLRFDFNFPRKLTQEEIEKIEEIVNKKISEGLKIVSEKMSLKKAIESCAQSEFGAKYPEKVIVYTILDSKNKRGWFSREICAGPHVKNTNELGKFKIIKEESIASGIRRIKAVIE